MIPLLACARGRDDRKKSMENPRAMEELETKLAFLERHAEEQDRVIYAQERRIEKMERAVRTLHERTQAASTMGDDVDPADEKPPHY